MFNVKRRARRGLTVSILMITVMVTGGSLYAATQDSSSTHRPALQGSIPVDEDQEATFPALAKLSIQEAIVAAQQAAAPGQVLGVGLEEEDGFLVYKVEIVEASGGITEVLVDAKNGTVLQLEQDHEDKDDDRNDDR